MSIDSWANRQGEVYLASTSVLGATLAELREFVAQADQIGIKDNANIYVSGLSESATYSGVYYFTKANIRSVVDDE